MLFAFVSSTNGIFGQDSSWTVFNNTNSGLPGNEVNTIAHDMNGHKWFGTVFNGAAIYDGDSWNVFDSTNSGLPDNQVNDIDCDQQGNTWFATQNGGVAKFDGVNWMIFNPLNSGLPTSSVKTVVVDQNGIVWFGTWAGVAKYDGVNWTVYHISNSGLPGNFIYSIAIDYNGDIWFGSYGFGVARFDGINWEIFNTSNSGLPYNYITDIEIDIDGNLWFATYGGGVAKYDGENWEVFQAASSGLPNNYVYSIACENDGTVWFGTSNGGVGRYDGENWEVYNTANSSLPLDVVVSILLDEAGDKWFATAGAGVALYREMIIPVELIDFSAEVTNDLILLKWSTASETNNRGFVIERSSNGNEFEQVGFVKGQGTTTEKTIYRYVDDARKFTLLKYRLRQTDYDGSVNYSSIIDVEILPENFKVWQNFPNPFNPVTTIEFDLPVESRIEIIVYDLLGRQVENLVSRSFSAGRHQVKFDASSIASGSYLYNMTAYGEDGRNSVITKKMMLIK